MKNLLTFDRLLAILTIPIAVFLIFVAYKAPRPNFPMVVGPHIWPIILLVLMSVCAIFIFLQAIRKEQKLLLRTETPAPDTGMKWYRKPAAAGALTIVGLLLYTVFLQSVGFIICTFLIVLYQTRVIQKGNWVRNIVSSLIFSLAIYYAMTKWLLMRLPIGLLGW